MIEYDVKALITNKRDTKTAFKTGYRPTFAIHPNYNTSGVITLIHSEWLSFDETQEAYIHDTFAKIDEFYVAEAHQKQGYGSALMSDMVRRLTTQSRSPLPLLGSGMN